MAISDLLRLLHDVSPYEGHDVAAHPGDMQGWGSTHPIIEQVIATLRPGVIVEVGTWKGASAIHMAKIARRLGLPTRIVCVDTWLGSPEHFLGLAAGWRESLRLRNGYPQLYFTFLTNVIEHQLTDVIIPLPNTADIAAHILHAKKIIPDLVYLDAAHEYASVKRDLHSYWPLLGDNGVLLGDDYDPVWPGVMQAADEFAGENNLRLVDCGGKFLFSRKPLRLPRTAIAATH